MGLGFGFGLGLRVQVGDFPGRLSKPGCKTGFR